MKMGGIVENLQQQVNRLKGSGDMTELKRMKDDMAMRIAGLVDRINIASDKGVSDVSAIQLKRQIEKNYLIVSIAITELENRIKARTKDIINS